MLRLIIADAELQTVPENMARDQAIRNIAVKNHKKPTEMLLDSNYMHTTIDKYFPGESNRRGRPDIIYIFLEYYLTVTYISIVNLFINFSYFNY